MDDEIVLRDADAVARVDASRGFTVTSVEVRGIPVLAERGIPIMFPFPNRIPHGRYTWRGREHAFDINERGRPNHIHGLVRDKAWRVTLRADDAAVATIDLAAIPDAMRQYPFPCHVDVTVALRDGALVHDVTVTNDGDTDMPMGYGLHPWFPGGADRAATVVAIPADAFWELDDLIPTGRVLPAAGDLDLRRGRALGSDTYDDVFTRVHRRADGWSVATLRYADGREIRLEADAAYREWVLYAPPDGAVIAIEPYSCATNAVNIGEGAGLVTLPPGQRWSARFRIVADIVKRG